MSIFAIALLALKFWTFSAISGDVLDACGTDGGILWIASSVHCAESDSTSVMLYRIEGDDVTLVDTLGVVRSDAVNCQVAPMTGGGCAAATEVGMGYTAVSLRAYGADGNLDWEVVEDGTCYDSPCGLVEASDGGLYLLWDSWSDDRGLWVLRAEPDGEVTWRTFVLPTLHPMPSRLCPAPDGGCVVAATTLVLEGETCVVLLDGEGRPETTWSSEVLQEVGAVSPVGMWADGDVIRSAWTLEPGQSHLDTLIILELSWDGTVSESGRFELFVQPGTTYTWSDPVLNGSAWAAELISEDIALLVSDQSPEFPYTRAYLMQFETGMIWVLP